MPLVNPVPAEQDSEGLARALRIQHGLPEGALLGKVVYATGTGNGHALLEPIGQRAQYRRGKQVCCRYRDLDEAVPEKRLRLGQIVTYSVDINSIKGPRAVEVRVLDDSLKNRDQKRAA